MRSAFDVAHNFVLTRNRWTHNAAGGQVKAAVAAGLRALFTNGDAGIVITNALSAVAFLKANHEQPHSTGSAKRDRDRVLQRREFYHVSDEVLDASLPNATKPLTGAGRMFAIRTVPDDPLRLLFREYGCGCVACVAGAHADCENVDRCGLWVEYRFAAAGVGAAAAPDDDEALDAEMADAAAELAESTSANDAATALAAQQASWARLPLLER